MSRHTPHRYRFATEAQWKASILIGADQNSREARKGLRPFVPFAGPADEFETNGGFAPAFSCVGEGLWRDGEGKLQRLPEADDGPHGIAAPYAIAHATRLVATLDTLWAAGDPEGTLQGFDLESLTRLVVVDIPNARVRDVARDRHDGLYLLLEQGSAWSIAHCDHAGRIQSSFVLRDVIEACALVYLGHTDRLVVLSKEPANLHWFSPDGGPAIYSVAITAIRPCFEMTALGSDGRTRLFAAGIEGAPYGGGYSVLTLDAEGGLLSDLKIDEKPTGVTANRSYLLVTTARGLLRFKTGTSVSRESSDVRTTFITPMLQSPPTDDPRRWLRVEATVNLPPGTTLELSYASTDDPAIGKEARRLASDSSMPGILRLHRLRGLLGPWRTFSIHGDAARPDVSVPLAAPLFDVRGQYLWVSATLIASPGADIPVLSQLVVLYPGRTLMENLPAMYQRSEAQPESFLRSLVGVLEATTQTIDARIADLGRYLHPRTAPDLWLDFVARWLGLPWDDALSLDQKRGIAQRAAVIAGSRGTRAGLEALLETLIPGERRRFRIVDMTADFGLAIVGGGARAGARLPVILGGLPSTAAELGSKAILGQARLPCADTNDDSAWLLGGIRVDVGANADEQAKWQPWLSTLIGEMVPINTRARLRWLGAAAFKQNEALGEEFELGDPPEPHLGSDAVTGITRLPGSDDTSLSDTRTDSTGLY